MAQGKEHKPTTLLREKVIDLASNGITHEEIAEELDLNLETLYKYYKKDLKIARISKVRQVGNNLFQKALNGDVSAQIFFLKTQGRWRTEDSKILQESNEDLNKEMKALRAELDKKNKREY
jgi:hypothetical protein